MKTTYSPVWITLAAVAFLAGVSAIAADTWLTAILTQKGQQYREAIGQLLAQPNAAARIQNNLDLSAPASAEHRQAGILLARLRHPEVFRDCEQELRRFREREDYNLMDRPGFLSGALIAFANRGPESKFVDERIGRREWQAASSSTNKLIFRDAVYRKVEKYTDAEVATGVARNAAARQALLEYILKFYEEGNAYEQTELVTLVERLWGSASSERHRDDFPADELLESICQSTNYPLVMRVEAVDCLPEPKQGGFGSLMLTALRDDTVVLPRTIRDALHYLEEKGSSQEKAALKSIQAKDRCKQAEINATLGLSAPRDAEADVEAIINISGGKDSVRVITNAPSRTPIP